MPKLLLGHRFFKVLLQVTRCKILSKTTPAVRDVTASCLCGHNTQWWQHLKAAQKGQRNSIYSHSIIGIAPIRRGSLKWNFSSIILALSSRGAGLVHILPRRDRPPFFFSFCWPFLPRQNLFQHFRNFALHALHKEGKEMAGCPAFIREFNVSIWASPTAPFFAVLQMTGFKNQASKTARPT